MQATKEFKLFNIGDEIFPVDLSGFLNVTTYESDTSSEDSVK